MSADDHDVLRHIAEQVADCFADSGYAFVEEDKIEGLAATLGSFLSFAGIPVNPPDRGDHPIQFSADAATADPGRLGAAVDRGARTARAGWVAR